MKYGHHFKLSVLQGAIDNVNEIKREKDFKDEAIEARGDWETCKPMDGYEDFSAEKLESEKAEDIKESELEIEAEKVCFFLNFLDLNQGFYGYPKIPSENSKIGGF
jgi:hypothetical protein